ncbi:uncharacterized protein LOC119365796 [Triticum dicoccoides]|uniref:uncharacterized protein LOC119365796 n=1 Tax=Triticum dicoccoides TaxID=85692 RepID=UPI00188E0426|nr:uncharacterized protein LOC119365796 [Triticum dicoccoides]
MEAEAEEAKAPPRMNRRQWRAARGNREDKWTRKRRLLLEATEEKRRAQVAAEAAADAAADAAEREDEEAAVAMRYRDSWIWTFSSLCGSYEEATSIKPMRYTDEPPPPFAGVGYANAVVVFSVKVTQLDDSLDWPLDVYGIVAARDSIDRNRNLLFNRTRDNCQRLTAGDASLLLTGPSRAVVIVDPVNYEVELKVKGDMPSEDKLLSLLVIEDKYYLPGDRRQGVHCHTYSSKLSTVEVTVGHLAKTVEATIAVQVVEGSWPTGHHGRFAARMASLDDLEMVLLDSQDGMVPVTKDGAIEFSRSVVSVEADGELTLGVDVWQGDDKAAKYQVRFVPRKAGRSEDICDVGFCKMRFTVAWSLLVNW